MEVMSSLLQLLPLLPLLQSGGYLGTMVLMVHVSVQACMSKYGMNVPLSKTLTDKRSRKDVFDIIHPYTLSAADMEEVVAAGEQQIELWLESFTATQKGLLGTTLSFYSKQYFQYFFSELRPYSKQQVRLPCGTSSGCDDPATVSCDACAAV